MAGRLCPACGLCCNGVLFADMRVRSGDRIEPWLALGFAPKAPRQTLRVPQPCRAYDRKLCRIYAERPARCHAFECRLLQQAQAGTLTLTAALRRIRQARRRVATVRRLLRQLGQTDEDRPLNRRCRQVLARPYDLAGNKATLRLRAGLMQAMHQLMRLLQRDFLA